MPLYEDRRNAVNHIAVSPQIAASLAIGPQSAARALVQALAARSAAAGRRIAASLDGWYGVPWNDLAQLLRVAADEAGFALEIVAATTLFRSTAEIASYKTRYILTGDPGFGWVNDQGTVADLMDATKVASLLKRLDADKRERTGAVLVLGNGAGAPALDAAYDLRAYADKTLQPLLWQLWDGKLAPYGRAEAQKDYGWKEYYYCDFHLLWKQKMFLLPRMDFYLEAIDAEHLKLIPRAGYDAIMQAALRSPDQADQDLPARAVGRLPLQGPLRCAGPGLQRLERAGRAGARHAHGHRPRAAAQSADGQSAAAQRPVHRALSCAGPARDAAHGRVAR